MNPASVEVTSPVTLKQLAPTPELREALSIDASNVTAVSELQLAIIAASNIAENYTSRVLRQERMTATYYTQALKPMFLAPPKWPLPVALTSLHLDNQNIRNLVYTDTARLIRRIDGDIFNGDLIVVDVTQGFIPFPSHDANVPDDLRHAVIDLARQIYLSRNRSPDVRAERLSDIASVSYQQNPESIPANVRMILDRYSKTGDMT